MNIPGLDKPAEVDASGVDGMSFNFGIKDPRVVFTILREKMYSNPHKAAMQEYLCNARDANRANGMKKVPIDLYFDDDEVRVKDRGLGIQPWDIAGIFVQYGESTKRDNDRMTGGWGLGCKTGFAIGDCPGSRIRGLHHALI